MKHIIAFFMLVLFALFVNTASASTPVSHLINIKQPADNKANIVTLVGSELCGGVTATPYNEVLNYGNACSVIKGHGCPFIAIYDKNMYKATFHCSDPKAGHIVKYTMLDGTVEDVFVVKPTRDCTVSVVLTYAPKNVTFGTKKVSYSYKSIDATGDGKIIVNGNELELHGAKVDGSLESPYSDTYMVAADKNVISGDIDTKGLLHITAKSEEASRTTALKINGGIHCQGTSADDMSLVISGTEVYAYSQGYQPVISGFTSFGIDKDKYMMIEPLGGRYDTDKRMLVDAHGRPATRFVIVDRESYDVDDHEYNFNNEDDYLTSNSDRNFNNEDDYFSSNSDRNFNNEDDL